MPGRRNPFVRTGRPPGMAGAPKMRGAGAAMRPTMGPGAGAGLSGMPGTGAGPMQGLQAAVPGAAFRRGGKVDGYAKMARHHDDASMRPTSSDNGFSSHDDHFCRGGKS